jgi:predicted nucleic acid-binding protein
VAFVAIYDACVLYPAPLRDLLIRLAVKHLFQAKWSDEILDEVFRNILKQRPDLNARKLERTRQLMIEAVPDCLVRGHRALIAGLALPDPDDRHVLAAAIRAGAQVVVTANLSDFPNDALSPFGIESQHPDDFVMNLIDLAANVVRETVEEQAAALRSPSQTVDQLLTKLAEVGLRRSSQRIREFSSRKSPALG